MEPGEIGFRCVRLKEGKNGSVKLRSIIFLAALAVAVRFVCACIAVRVRGGGLGGSWKYASLDKSVHNGLKFYSSSALAMAMTASEGVK